MNDTRRSYWKTVIPAFLFSVVLMASAGILVFATQATRLSSAWSWISLTAAALVVLASVFCLLIAAGGLICLRRDRLEEVGKPYGLPISARVTV